MFFNHRKGKGLPNSFHCQQGRLTPSVRDPWYYSTAVRKMQEVFEKSLRCAVCSDRDAGASRAGAWRYADELSTPGRLIADNYGTL